jgi:hypothetical protein
MEHAILKLMNCILMLSLTAAATSNLFVTEVISFPNKKNDSAQTQRDRIQLACFREFGATIDSKLNLFEINRDFVLQITYDERNRLLKFEVKPKYFLNEAHPEWTAPDDFPLLSQDLFRNLVNRLETIEAKGKLTVPINKIAFVTNQTGHYREGYDKAALRWGQVGPGVDPPNGVRFFNVEYGRLKRVKKERPMKKRTLSDSTN